jgi:hypothetical protein
MTTPNPDYCTAIFNSAGGVTCDPPAELYLSADPWVTCNIPGISAEQNFFTCIWYYFQSIFAHDLKLMKGVSANQVEIVLHQGEKLMNFKF